jgi:N-acyl-D-amino-acid deacylase
MLRLTALLFLLCAAQWGYAETYDVVFKNARVVDGTGNPWQRADVAIRGERIAYIGSGVDLSAQTVIDASDLIVAPGFIDTHSHASNALISEDRSGVPGLLTQGITSVLINPDGRGAVDLATQRVALKMHGLGVNVGQYVPHGSVREAVMNMDDRPPTEAELFAMEQLVKAGMEVGAFGLSSGTFYAPASFSNNDELIALAEVVAQFGGAYNSHIRDESNYSIGLQAAVAEVIEVAEQAKIPGVITHIKALGPPVWGMAEAVVAQIRAARLSGVQVYTDQYPYLASQTSLAAALLPRWAFEGGREAMLRRFNDPEDKTRLLADMQTSLDRRGGADRIQFSRSAETPQAIGLTLEIWARQTEQSVLDAVIELLRDGNPGIVSFNMNPDDVAVFMRAPWNMTASDGSYPVWGVGAPHPRAFGSFPRKIHQYVNEDPVVTLEDAIRSMTSLPAQVYRFKERGLLKVGFIADVVAFDFNEIEDHATFTAPWQLSSGVHHVLIGGEFALKDGQVLEPRWGRLLDRGIAGVE